MSNLVAMTTVKIVAVFFSHATVSVYQISKHITYSFEFVFTRDNVNFL